jgi:hypothetical protein
VIDATASACTNQVFVFDGTNAVALAPAFVTGVAGGAIVLPGATSGSNTITPAAVAGTGSTTTLPSGALVVPIVKASATANQFVTHIPATGVQTTAQPACADLSNSNAGCSAGITASSSESLTNKTLDVEGTGNSITTVQKIWIQAATCAGTTGALNWDTIATLAPAAVCSAGTTNTGLIRGTASFLKTEVDQIQTHLMLPSDWSGAIDLRFKWQTAATTGSVVWQAAAICVADAEVNDAAWNTASTVTDAAKGTTLQTNDATITGLTATGCAAGELLHLKVFRDPDHASDDLDDTASLIGVEVTTRRAQ